MPKQDRPTWSQTFLEIARTMAKRSPDPSSQVGSVIVGPKKEIRAVGYNGLPRGVDNNVPARMERPAKYLWMIHSEMNSLLACAREGIPTNGCIMYVSWLPCADCARAIIQAGIAKVVVHDLAIPTRWRAQFIVSMTMFELAGVSLCTEEDKPVLLPDILWVGNRVRYDGEVLVVQAAKKLESGGFSLETQGHTVFFPNLESVELAIILTE